MGAILERSHHSPKEGLESGKGGVRGRMQFGVK